MHQGGDQVNMDYNRIVTKLCLSWAENYICFSHKDDLGIGYIICKVHLLYIYLNFWMQ